jgi:serine/threonine-protein kinase
MQPERWKRVEELFSKCLELPTALRSRHLAEACAGDPELRREVESLLAHAGKPSFLETPAVEQIAPDALPGADEERWIGRRVGAFQVDKLLAAGGMGAVYLAHRDDDAFEQLAAVKIVKPGFDTGGLLARFLQERQTLAALDHPNIASLLDGGTTEDGRPYLIMEYIDGLPLHTWCAEEQPSLNRRIELFEAICSGVQHAHRNLVVHRDLKPMNIMVTREGVPKLLDFGIAKLLETSIDGSQTLSPLQLLTPEYASPEQIRGEVVTTASDVYSLGVILYELLAKAKPYEVETRARHEMERIVCERRVDPPSRHQPQLATDLDAITMMCLRKEPERRYEGVGQLAEDLQRFRSQLPVRARPDSLWYRVGKYMRRNRLPVALSGLASVLLIAGVASTLYQSDLARRRAVTSARVADVLVDIFLNADPWETGGESLPVRELLRRGVDTARRDLAGEPEILGAFLATLGRVHLNLGDQSVARALLVEADDLLAGRARPDQELLGDTLFHLGVALRRSGELLEAERVHRQAMKYRIDEFGENSLPVASSRNTLALVLQNAERYEEAETLLLEALRTRRRLLPPESPEIAVSLSNLGWLALQRDDLGTARDLFEEALVIQESAWDGDHPDLATTLNNLGYLDQIQEDLGSALDRHQAALAMRLRVFGEDHPHTASSLNNLGLVYYEREDYEQAELQFQRATEIARARLAADHPLVVQFESNLASAREEIAAGG